MLDQLSVVLGKASTRSSLQVKLVLLSVGGKNVNFEHRRTICLIAYSAMDRFEHGAIINLLGFERSNYSDSAYRRQK